LDTDPVMGSKPMRGAFGVTPARTHAPILSLAPWRSVPLGKGVPVAALYHCSCFVVGEAVAFFTATCFLKGIAASSGMNPL
jgi:hypothetical protein